MSQRLVIPSYRNHITQKVKNAQRIFYSSVHDNEKSAETFLRQYVHLSEARNIVYASGAFFDGRGGCTHSG